MFVGVDPYAVGVVEQVVAPGVDDAAVGIKYDHGVRAAAEAVDAALTVHTHAADPTQRDARRQLRPPLDVRIAMRSTTYGHLSGLQRESVARPS